MARKLIERPRSGSSIPNHEIRRHRRMLRNARTIEEYDLCRDWTSMRPRFHDRREFSDFFAPLLRFLRRRVGRPWHDVLQEIQAPLSRRNVIDRHLLHHVHRFVHQSAAIEDGQVWACGRAQPLRDTGWTFFVHPETGTLCVPSERGRRWWSLARRPPPRLPHVTVGSDHLYLLFDGQWYEARLAPIADPDQRDVFAKGPVGSLSEATRERWYGRADRAADWKRQLSRREKRRAGLLSRG